MTTNIMPISDLRRNTAQVIDVAKQRGNAVYITQHGRPTVVIINYEEYEQLKAQAEKPAQPNSMMMLAALAQDLGVEDLAENHDQHLYGTDDLAALR